MMRTTYTDMSATLQQQVYDTLRADLMGGRFLPGETLSLRKVAFANGVSPMPAREAFKRLLSEGALQFLPNRTIAVPKLSIEDFHHLMRVRAMVEGYAAELASRAISSRGILSLARKNSLLLKAFGEGEADRAMKLNMEFHLDLYEWSKSAVLIPMIHGLWMRMGPIIRAGLEQQTVEWSATEHKVALRALELRDSRSVRRAIERDILGTVSAFEKIGVFNVPALGDRSSQRATDVKTSVGGAARLGRAILRAPSVA
jgi:DNA-binding GntR family transcriptional regulator